jgi:hypothetical protein
VQYNKIARGRVTKLTKHTYGAPAVRQRSNLTVDIEKRWLIGRQSNCDAFDGISRPKNI